MLILILNSSFHIYDESQQQKRHEKKKELGHVCFMTDVEVLIKPLYFAT